MKKMIFLLVAYAIAPIVAGHGLMLMAFHLLPTQGVTWQLMLSWCAVLAVVSGCCMRAGSLEQLCVQLASAFILYGSWVANILFINQFNAEVERPMALESMILFSAPFQLASVVVISLLVIQLKRELTKRQIAHADQR
jgi:hypothetical protein